MIHIIKRFVVGGILLGLLSFAAGNFFPTSKVRAFTNTINPFLIVSSTDFPVLESRASRSPWLEMKNAAVLDATTLQYGGVDIFEKSDSINKIVSAGALAYIVDSPNKVTYKNKIRDTLMNWSGLVGSLSCADWGSAVPPGRAFFQSVIALDIIHNDLTPTELSNIESQLGQVGNWYYGQSGCSWKENLYAVQGIWAAYTGDLSRFNTAKVNYRNTLLSEFSSDGVFYPGAEYAFARLGGGRESKSFFMDILEYLHEGTYYTDPEFIQFYNWLYSSAVTPLRTRISFGDSGANDVGPSAISAANRADRFSLQAGQNAAWVSQNMPPRGRLLDYLFLSTTPATPVKPQSNIRSGGQATFWENNSATTSMFGALHSPDGTNSHAHKDVNAVHLMAYGENILQNSGYNGWNNSCAGNTWSYIHDTAVSSNTVLIDGKDHTSTIGGGVTAGFTNGTVEFGRASSGGALPNGAHYRNLVSVYPQDGLNGYWILFDEIVANRSNSKGSIAIHPSSANYVVNTANQEYTWTINAHGLGNGVQGTVFLATTPQAVEIRTGALCSWDESFAGTYLYTCESR